MELLAVIVELKSSVSRKIATDNKIVLSIFVTKVADRAAKERTSAKLRNVTRNRKRFDRIT